MNGKFNFSWDCSDFCGKLGREKIQNDLKYSVVGDITAKR